MKNSAAAHDHHPHQDQLACALAAHLIRQQTAPPLVWGNYRKVDFRKLHVGFATVTQERANITANSRSREAASSSTQGRSGRPDRRSHFPGSTKIPGNEPVLQSAQGLTSNDADRAEDTDEASNIIRNHSRYPSRCCNHHAVVAFTFYRASSRRYGHWTIQQIESPLQNTVEGMVKAF